MAGAAVLLIAGTEILNWYWVVGIALASLGVGLYRLRGTIPSEYKIAQWIDRRLHLADALSTAKHFAEAGAGGDEAIRARQREDAESVARGIDVRAAVPFSRPRFLYAAIALTAVAAGLFAVRFAVTQSLSLQPSLVKIAFDTFFPQKQELAQQKRKDAKKDAATDASDKDSATTEQDQQPPDSELNKDEQPEESSEQGQDQSKEQAKQQQQADPEQPQGDNPEKGDKSQNGNDASNEGNKSPDGKSADPKSAQDSKQGSNEGSSMMDKLKDALSSMMNKMKPSNSQSGSQNQQNAQKQDAQNGQKSGQKGQQSQKQSQDSSQAQSDQSDSGDQSQSADAKGAEKSSDKNASSDSKSGIGSADGDKAAKEAEQLQAMGKISEIFGKRAQNMQGEVMVEVGQSKQQLKTPWAPKQATHTDAGGEIHRDEVPLMYQEFVEQYFEQIRKAPEPAKTPKSKN